MITITEMSIFAENTKAQSLAQSLHSEDTGRCIIVDADAEKKLVRKIDLYLMPSIFILYLFSYMDRSNIGLAKIVGMEEDLHLTSHQYYTAVIVWVIGYTISAVPPNCDLLNFYMVSKERAVCLPISQWHSLEILLIRSGSKRFIIFLTAGILSGAFGGVISGAITSTLDGAQGIRGWRWLFIVEWVATAGVSLIAHWTLLDYPHRSRGLSEEERKLAQQRLVKDGIDQGDSKTQNTSMFILLLKALSNWRTWVLIPGYITLSGAGAISYFYPTLINDMGYTSINAQYMTVPLYIASMGTAVGGQHDSRMVFFALTAAIRNYIARYVFLCFINMTLWTGGALALSFATTALASVTPDVRAIMLAWIPAAAALAQLYGSAPFPAEDSPGYVVGFSVFAATFAVGSVCHGLANILFKRLSLKGTYVP
ncbi:unnamed protein product [Penicillium nalgiovense]|nr:unnamed protein product [Penicillium nalgiovense]